MHGHKSKGVALMEKIEWMDEAFQGEMESVDECMDKWTNGWRDGGIDMDGLDERMDGWSVWTDARKDSLMDG
jgi:hypothetical protein